MTFPSSPLPFMFVIITFLLALLHRNAAETSTSTSTNIVHMDKALFPQVFKAHHEWFNSTIDSIKSATVKNSSKQTQKLVYSYGHAMHGFSVVLSLDELKSLKNAHEFVAAYPDITANLHTTHTFEFLSLDPSRGLWHASNLGDEVIVGVIDSGVWPESESFKDDGMTKEIPKRWKGTW
ncbi:subtilisin-like protease SBT3 isoform X2 [Lotus japonicus]|uniref:subtilisin-like protease SBT3 isoform X2 n=1 Tax=Lotus japonicus TaxID=34305 RepID=UPI0025906BCB|nr:subtilisin-like protease SBT3 isoform X2 [Lotus japonicus]